ncbi:MAG: hypothetical protein JRJ70_04870 [Deltaproteobacteria bacterium]|nr:hypothetical protein [Deltaproteobacteria bacterium]
MVDKILEASYPCGYIGDYSILPHEKNRGEQQSFYVYDALFFFIYHWHIKGQAEINPSPAEQLVCPICYCLK